MSSHINDFPAAGHARAAPDRAATGVLESRPTVSPAGPPTPEQPDEFAGIPGPRRSRHPVVAAAAVALAVFLIVQVRHDLGYALSPATPRDLGDARAVATRAAGDLPINRYVRLAAPADRESALLLDTRGSWQFRQFFRLLGTGNRVFVRRVPDPLPVVQAERDSFAGRLIRFRDLSFQAAIRQHFLAHVAATHFFPLDQVRAALGGAATITDLAGERVELRREDELAIDTARPDEVRVELPAARAPDAARARALVEAQGGQVVEATTDGPRQVVRARFAPDRRDAALSALGDLDRHVRIGPARVTTRARLADLAQAADGLAVRRADGGTTVLPAGEVQAIRTAATVQIPEDALLLLEGETPRDHLRTVLVVVLLAGFAAMNLLALRRAS